jgi:UDP-galactopyranose mutase
VVYEYPRAEGDPYYPVPRPENAAIYLKYRALAESSPNVRFVGRLGTYRYYNMDQVVGQALSVTRKIGAEESSHRKRRLVEESTATAAGALLRSA